MNNRLLSPGQPIVFPLLMIWIAGGIILLGCQTNRNIIATQETVASEETIIPFETIEKAQLSGTGDDYAGGTKIVIITRQDEIEKVGNFISLDAQMNLQKLDYAQSIAIVVFQGELRGFTIEIQKISQINNEIIVYAQVSSPLELFLGIL